MPTLAELEQLQQFKTQVGGDHYRNRSIQPWDFIASHDYLDKQIEIAMMENAE